MESNSRFLEKQVNDYYQERKDFENDIRLESMRFAKELLENGNLKEEIRKAQMESINVEVVPEVEIIEEPTNNESAIRGFFRKLLNII